MSNKLTIKRAAKPANFTKPKEEKRPGFPKNRRKLVGMIPAIAFIVIAIWYFIH